MINNFIEWKSFMVLDKDMEMGRFPSVLDGYDGIVYDRLYMCPREE